MDFLRSHQIFLRGGYMDIVKKEKELSWEPHPYLPIQIKPFLS